MTDSEYTISDDDDLGPHPLECPFVICSIMYIVSILVGSIVFFSNVTVFNHDMSFMTKAGYAIVIIVVYAILISVYIGCIHVYCKCKEKYGTESRVAFG